MISTLQQQSVTDWYRENGGAPGKPVAHVLRMLREMTEMCVAAGASPIEILNAVNEELEKAHRKNELKGYYSHVETEEEMADVLIMATVICDFYALNPNLAVAMKLEVLRKRQWEVDENGVLWRPGTRATKELDRTK